MVQHKSRAITYITPAARAEAVKEQNLVIRGKGKLVRRKLEGPLFAVPSGQAGSFDKKQSDINKDLGYW